MNSTLIRHCESSALVLSALAVLVLLWHSPLAALALGAGASVTLLDFVLLRRWVSRTLSGGGSGAAAFVVFVLAKWTLLGSVLLVLVRYLGLSVVWLGVGVSGVVLSFVGVALFVALWRGGDVDSALNEPEPGSVPRG